MAIKEITHSQIKNGQCNVNVNFIDEKTKEVISSEQYRGIVTHLGNITRIEKTGQSKP